MRKSIAIAAASLLSLAACMPQAYVCTLDMRYPSTSGMDIAGKSVAVVYPDNAIFRDSLFLNCFADGLATGIEKDFFDGEKSVGVYSIPYVDGSDYFSRDTLADMVMATDADVVLMLSLPSFGEVVSDRMAGSVQICGYDSMDRRDTLVVIPSSARMYAKAEGETLFASDAQYMGLSASQKLSNVWKTESYSVIYYQDFSENWEKSLVAVEQMEWQTAIDIWMGMLDSSTGDRLSSLEYDIALGCYMLGNYSLALEWLDMSDKTVPISLSAGLRKRIEARM